MNSMFRILIFCTLFITSGLSVIGQNEQPNLFDYGRMWTFEEPPTDWFKTAYGMDVNKAWFDDVRKSSLRFATWCSASFVSSEGLIMTNHHCSRDVAISVQSENENFDKNGFYATTLDQERRVPSLFVEQLIMIADITNEVNAYKNKATSDEEIVRVEQEALKKIESEYAEKSGWEGLRLQTVSFYSGGKYSLYGYKKYDDIRLVLIPENELGFYGGDPDNFTYPRYNLDVTFWRAYDDNGRPLDTSANFFQFNIDGIHEGTPVFVIGNPGRTERYRTVAQLEYDRDYRFKHLLKWITNRRDMQLEAYNEMVNDPKMEREAQNLLSSINGLSNSIKAYEGIMGGLHNEAFMNRKSEMENVVRTGSKGPAYWNQLGTEYEKLEPHAWAINLMGPSALRGNTFLMMHELAKYKNQLESKAGNEELAATTENLVKLNQEINIENEKNMMRLLMDELTSEVYAGDNTLERLLAGQTTTEYLNNLFSTSKFLEKGADISKLLSKKKTVTKSKDPLIKSADVLISRYQQASTAFSKSSAKRNGLEAKIANQAFNVFGTSLPPDATFTLRISDGVVKGYNYNGTEAPINTTYFGMYDRHYSNNQTFPWSLPEKWMNPAMELLQSPLNFVSTNDIIGGNSGSAIINQEGEAVGLIFDGNIESLPGNFIFDEEYNRSVSVHAGGIYAAMKYIYKADRIISELNINE